MDLSAQLDRAIGPSPSRPFDLTALVADGRRARRRRRLAVAASGLAAALVVGGASAVLAGGTTADPRPEPATSVPGVSVAPLDLVSWSDGQWSVERGAAVLRQVEDPYGRATPGGSVGLELRWHQRTLWVASWWDPGNTAASSSVSWADLESSSFETWVSQQHATLPPGTWPPTLQASPGPGAS